MVISVEVDPKLFPVVISVEMDLRFVPVVIPVEVDSGPVPLLYNSCIGRPYIGTSDNFCRVGP